MGFFWPSNPSLITWLRMTMSTARGGGGRGLAVDLGRGEIPRRFHGRDSGRRRKIAFCLNPSAHQINIDLGVGIEVLQGGGDGSDTVSAGHIVD